MPLLLQMGRNGNANLSGNCSQREHSTCGLASEMHEFASLSARFQDAPNLCDSGRPQPLVSGLIGPQPPVSKSFSDHDLPGLAPSSSRQPCGDSLYRQPIRFRHSFDCLLVAAANAGADDSAAASPAALRKVASCATTAKEKAKKCVHFADEAGKPLTHVRWIREPSHVPPKLSIHTKGLSWKAESPEEAEGGGAEQQQQQQQQQLVCKFAQPCSKYIMFHESIAKNCVSLSSANVNNRTVSGTIVVKNISFAKRVFVRLTFDDWSSWQDVEAAYSCSQDAEDMFSFSFNCPESLDSGADFCVGFQCDAGSFWDSNGGANYRIAVRRRQGKQPLTKDCKPNYSGVCDFAEFSVWQHFSDSVYY